MIATCSGECMLSRSAAARPACGRGPSPRRAVCRPAPPGLPGRAGRLPPRSPAPRGTAVPWPGPAPRPVQDRLPIWLDYQGPKGARRAGLMGEGLLTLAASSWPHYRDGLAEAGHDRAAARMGGGVQAYLTDDPERDWPLVAPHIAYAQDSYRRYMVEGTDHPVPRPVDPDRLRTKGPDAGPMSYFLFGTPEHVAAAIRDYAGQAPVQTVWLGAGDGRGGGDHLRRPGHPAQQRRRDPPSRHQGPAGQRGRPGCLGRHHADQPARHHGGHSASRE